MISLVFITAFLMEAIGSYISVIGLGSLFSGDLVILTMAVILDVAKVTTVSFLYQHWERIKLAMKSYLLVAVAVLMVITSAGAFGYLSGAFQKALQPNMEITLRVDTFKRERDQLTKERTELTEQRLMIDKQIAQLSGENVNGRRQLIWSFKPESTRIASRLKDVTDRVDQLNKEILRVESENIDNQVHVGPITYVARVFGVTVDEASKWIILTIIFVFDPLAIALIVAGNFLIKLRHQDQSTSNQTSRPKYGGKYAGFHESITVPNFTAPEPIPEQQITTPEPDHADVQQVLERNDPPEPTDEDRSSDQSVDDLVASDRLDDAVVVHPDEIQHELVVTPEEFELLLVDPNRMVDAPVDDDQDDDDGLLVEWSAHDQEEPPETSSLEAVNINLPGGLIREGIVTHSTKRYLYAGQQ